MKRALWALCLAFGVALAPAESAECHAGHCHGPQVCGGGWKDHPETASAEGSGKDEKEACAGALALLEGDTEDRALAACDKHHPCGTCPDKCSGCGQVRPDGRLGAEAKRSRAVSKNADGSVGCKVTAEVIFRCRCGHCLPNK